MLGRQEIDDGLSVVAAARPSDLMKLRVKQLFQPLAVAANSGVMEFDFEGVEFLQQGCHGR